MVFYSSVSKLSCMANIQILMFVKIVVSRGMLAKCSMCGGKDDNCFVANSVLNPTVK